MRNFYPDCAIDRSLLNQRLRKNPKPWTDKHTQAVREIKSKVKNLPILYVADDKFYKIVETDTSNIGWGGVLKQKPIEDDPKEKEQVVLFVSGVWSKAEKNYTPIEKEVKAAWYCVSKFSVHLANKYFLLRTDAKALEKVLSKEIKNPEDAKFARWQALFAYFSFKVEHIRGSDNCIPDFLSREYIQHQEHENDPKEEMQLHCMVILTEWNQAYKREELRYIADDEPWPIYAEKWRPTWILRNTQVLDGNFQNHTDLQHLVPGRKVCPKGNRWIHEMMYSHSMAASHEAERSLSKDFWDLYVISTGGSDRSKEYYKSFVINRVRKIGPYIHGKFTSWPHDDPKLLFPDTVYNFAGYERLWWDLLNKDGPEETHYTKLKFAPTWINEKESKIPWLTNWWHHYGVSPYNFPDIIIF